MQRPIISLPSALESHDAILGQQREKRLAVFLDFDGTLAAIADRPEQAKLSDTMRDIVHRLGDLYSVAVISGRDRPDVEALVDLDNLIYAGSHGFDISGGADLVAHEAGNGFEKLIKDIGDRLENQLSGIDGSLVERKKFSIAVHYRLVAEDQVDRVNKVIDGLMADHPNLGLIVGKKIFDILPPVDWDKGRAVLWLLDRLEPDDRTVLPVYIGDDVTDEAAFEALADTGVCICVHGENDDRTTWADYSVRNTEEVGAFLSLLVELDR